MPGAEAFVSLATNDSYATGAITLGRSIRDSGTHKRLALMITNGVSEDMRCRLSQIWDELVVVEELDSGDAEHLALLTRPELGVTFSKLHAWRLTQYSKCVFLDADALVLQNVDELFDREELSAAPDIGWPDCFNSGVFVFEPSMETFQNLVDLARQSGSFDGGDQGLLNLYWSEWATKDIKYHLPFIFNVVPNVTYGYAPAYQRFGRNAKIVHFIGPVKPWQHRYLPEVDSVILYPGTYASQNAAQDFIKRWWQVYHSTWSTPPAATGWTPTSGRGIPCGPSAPGPPPNPLYSRPHIPVEWDTTHACVLIPIQNPPHHMDDISEVIFPPDTVLMDSHHNISRAYHAQDHHTSLDRQSDLSRKPVTYSTPYHFEHYAHQSLSLYTPGNLDHLYGGVIPDSELNSFSFHKPTTFTTDSTESDVNSVAVVTDSVLPYHDTISSPQPPPTHIQEQGEAVGMGGAPEHWREDEHRRAFEQGRIEYQGRDSFDSIMSHMELLLGEGSD